MVPQMHRELWLRGLTIREYIASRGPVTGIVYYAMLVLFAIMPRCWPDKAIAGQNQLNNPH